MAHQAIYRKWRPMVFEDIIGQGHITNTLKKQITTGRIGHAYLFCGTRGTGKTTCAKVLSRAVNCLDSKDGSPCNECAVCKGIIDGSIMDVTEIDAASNNGVDNIREIRDDVRYAASTARYTVYIIDEVHMLSGGAFNALLKTLEEPPEHVIFILATTEPHKVPQTILSRCQRFDFRRIKPSDIIVRMKQIAYGDGFEIDDEALTILARLADGSMRDGLSLLERVVSACGDKITANDITNTLGLSDTETSHRLLRAVTDGNVDEILSIVDKVLSDGKDLRNFIDSFIKYVRDLMVIKVSTDAAQSLDYSEDELVTMRAIANKLTFEKISHAATLLSDAQSEARWLKSPRVVYEMALIKLSRPELDRTPQAILDKLSSMENAASPTAAVSVDTSALEKRIAQLEEKIKNGITVKESEEEEKKTPEVKKEVSKRLYEPIPPNELHSQNPVVTAARNWNSTVRAIIGAYGYLMGPLMGREITIDREGIVLLYNRDEVVAKNLAQRYIDKIQSGFTKATGSNLRIKAVWRDDLDDDCIIDVWALQPPTGFTSAPQEKTAVVDENTVEAPTEEIVPPTQEDSDPLNTLITNFPEIVETTDDREFLNYSSADGGFSQSEINADESEEFLSEEETADNE